MNIQNIGLGQAPPSETRAGDAARKPAAQSAVESAPAQVRKKTEATPQQLLQAVQSINRKLANNTALEFSVDQSTGRTVVRVTDKDSGEVIRQIPSETALAIAESIGEFQKGLLLRQEA